MPPPAVFARRLALWLIVCAVSAAPSFVFAVNLDASVAGMVVAVVLFALAYAMLTSTAGFERLHARPFVRETLYVGYGLRLALSALIGVAALARADQLMWLFGPDFICGILSARGVGLVTNPGGGGDANIRSFLGAFLTTCLHGLMMNVLIFIVMAIAYGLQRAIRKHPDHAPRGFDVVTASE